MPEEKPAPPLHIGQNIPKTAQPFIGKQRGALFAIAQAVLRIKIKRGSTDKVFISEKGGLVFQLGGFSGGGDGWRWATIKKYSSATGYEINESVVVGPNNAAIEDGAMSGHWLCVQVPSSANLPQWPPPGLTEDQAFDDPDNALIFWWPLAIFCT